MKRVKGATIIAIFTICILFMSSCRTDFDFDKAHSLAETLEQYNASFKEVYGEIDPEETWDFSSNIVTRPAANATRANSQLTLNDIGERLTENGGDKYYYVPDKLLDWLHTNLLPSENNSAKGKSFFLSVPNTKFYVVPIYQGVAWFNWNLGMKFQNGDYCTFWYKCDIQAQYNGSKNWVKANDKNGTANWGTQKTDAVRAPIFKIDTENKIKSHVGEELDLYLDVVSDTGRKKIQYASANQMRALILPDDVIANLNLKSIDPAAEKAMIIGAEDKDSYYGDGDWDYDDFVFLVVGCPDLPPVIEYIARRYMIEDLGATSTSDIDFNDVVVDLIQTYEKTADGTKNNLKETATIRALGGTLNFDLMIGQHTICTKQDNFTVGRMYNTGWNAARKEASEEIDYEKALKEIDLSKFGTLPIWDGDNSKIHLVMRPRVEDNVESDKKYNDIGGSNLGKYEIKYPSQGEVPAIIAFDLYKEWRPERVSIANSTDYDWWGKNK